MTIRVRLPNHAAEQIAFAYSPLQETVLSLHVLVEPKHHPLQHLWVRAMRVLPPALKRKIAAFSFLYRSYIPTFLLPSPTGPLQTFHEELATMCTLSQDLLRLGFTRHLLDWPDPPAESRSLTRQAAEEPVALAQRFAALLHEYWEAGFAAEWERVEPRLAASVAEAGHRIAVGDLWAMVGQLWPEVHSDEAA